MILRRLAFANLLAQAAIIVTGVTVRVTGSGLGCPTWPQCVPGSYVPTVEQEQSWHKYVEFGNRTLTFALTAIAVATVIAVWRNTATDSQTRRLALVPVLGTVFQAGLGGVTVLTGLNPYTVMAHFLVSIGIVAASHALWVRVSPQQFEILQRQQFLDLFSRGLVLVAFVVIALGTVVTGSGPHSGDADEPARLGLDPQLMSWIHADAVWLASGIALILWMYARWSLAHAVIERRARTLVIVMAMQGGIGYLQYWTDLPWFLVVIHAAFAAWFWIAVLHVRSAIRSAMTG